jgi:hypothetical protein
VLNNVGYPPNALTVMKLRQARWAKNIASQGIAKFLQEKLKG